MTITYNWWKDATIYQIWPASYKDSNGDGIGDIPGIISTLDYLKDLGIDIIWLSPMYNSPQDDMGYDISDYEAVYPKYGTMEDMEELIGGLHSRGMKLILDLVINHTSSEHKWFKESRSSKSNPKRNWYIWKPPKYDENGKRQPPNNWGSHFSGSAWEYDEVTGEYYLRLYAKSQPDLNWENPEVRSALYESALRFWFNKGVDGFRIDTAGLYSKDQKFPDVPIVFPDKAFQPCDLYTLNGSRIHEFHKEMYSEVISKYDVMTVGEVGRCSREAALKYVSAKEGEMNMIFLFNIFNVGTIRGDRFKLNPYKLIDFKKAVEEQCEFIEGTDAWSTVFLENHDSARSVTRFGNPKYYETSAKLLSLLQITLTGTLFIYQGQEIAMSNLPRSWSIDEYKDINTVNYYKYFQERFGEDKDFDEKKKELMDAVNLVARDHARSPVQWNDSPYGGFSTVEPWTRVNDNYKTINVASQVEESNSVLNFWKRSLKLRKQFKDLLIYGSFKILDYDNQKVFTYVKYNSQFDSTSANAYVVMNFSTDSIKFEKLIEGDFQLVHSNVDNLTEEILTPYEGRVYIVS
ncbi:alpha-glucosidase maltase [Scheffersomyces amazonensis]|uniref:alpha-glucosidase maltase n=1 Tax=Scheffersomyces amazonensis TaxID=1078765 RepID=UPI00315D1ECD